jgi:hypothetical protein
MLNTTLATKPSNAQKPTQTSPTPLSHVAVFKVTSHPVTYTQIPAYAIAYALAKFHSRCTTRTRTTTTTTTRTSTYKSL